MYLIYIYILYYIYNIIYIYTHTFGNQFINHCFSVCHPWPRGAPGCHGTAVEPASVLASFAS